MVRAIIVAHGDLAAELIRTAEKVFGRFNGVTALSNAGRAPQALSDELEAALDKSGEGGCTIIFADFFGGSCCHACIGVERERDDVRVITGVNLPMLLAFLYKREEVPFEELAEELTKRGHDSIQVVEGEAL